MPTHLIGNDAFQEADTTGITRPCTKHNYLVKDVNELARVMHEAFYVATQRPPRPGGDRPAEGHPVRARRPTPAAEPVKHRSYHPRREPDPMRDRARRSTC